MSTDNLAIPQTNVNLPRYFKSDNGMNYNDWTLKKKPLVYAAPYFQERKIGDVVYRPSQGAALVVNNFSSQKIYFGVWKLLAENKENFPNQENYLPYILQQDAFLKGELSEDDSSSCAFINQHIRIFADVLGDSYNQADDRNGLVKATNTGNTVDLPQGTGHAQISANDNGTISVLPSISLRVVQDSALLPNTIIVEKCDNATNISINIKLTQAGITLPTKFSTIDAGLQSYVLKHTQKFLFCLFKADDPEKELIVSKIFEFNLNQAVIVTDSERDPNSVDITVVSKSGCLPYTV